MVLRVETFLHDIHLADPRTEVDQRVTLKSERNTSREIEGEQPKTKNVFRCCLGCRLVIRRWSRAGSVQMEGETHVSEKCAKRIPRYKNGSSLVCSVAFSRTGGAHNQNNDTPSAEVCSSVGAYNKNLSFTNNVGQLSS